MSQEGAGKVPRSEPGSRLGESRLVRVETEKREIKATRLPKPADQRARRARGDKAWGQAFVPPLSE